MEDSEENLKRVITALSKMEDGAARELTPRDLLENVVVKIADEVQVDVSRSAWRISFNDAIGSALNVQIDGIDVPYVDLKTLIGSNHHRRGFSCARRHSS